MAINMPIAALYARVSSEKQSHEGTIASQLAALHERIAADGLHVADDLAFVDDGVSGNTLVRPGLERLRDAVANGAIDRLYIFHPDRLSRNYAYQVVLVEEFTRAAVHVIFLNHSLGDSPEEKLLLQMQGMIAEYERTKITERCRRGKRYAAQRGSLSVLCQAPYGYRYLPKHAAGAGGAAWQINAEEAAVVQQIFGWFVHERLSLAQIARRLQERAIPTRHGKPWSRSTVGHILKNSAYQGTAYFGKRRNGPRRPRLRPIRGASEPPRRSYGTYAAPRAEQEAIAVPAIITSELFAAAQEQLVENRRRWRGRPYNINFLLRGLAVCGRCGYAYVGVRDRRHDYVYYRCCSPAGAGACGNGIAQAMPLEQAVWNDLCDLLRDPERIRREYERRLEHSPTADPEADRVADAIAKVKRAMARLIDAYEDGLLDKSDFSERLQHNKDRLTRLQEQAERHAQRRRTQHELRLIIACLEDFRDRIHTGLEQADAATRRELLLALVKRIEIDQKNVRIIYKVTPPDCAAVRNLQSDCPSRCNTAPDYTGG